MKKECKAFPCHSKLEDCSLCYCLLYPCHIEGLGEMYKGVWDCSKCELVHNKTIAEIIKRYAEYIIKIFKGIDEYQRKTI